MVADIQEEGIKAVGILWSSVKIPECYFFLISLSKTQFSPVLRKEIHWHTY